MRYLLLHVLLAWGDPELVTTIRIPPLLKAFRHIQDSIISSVFREIMDSSTSIHYLSSYKTHIDIKIEDVA